MVNATGLSDQPQMTKRTEKQVTVSEDIDDEEDRFRVGGKEKTNVELSTGSNVSEVPGSDSEECAASSRQVAIAP